MTDNKKKEELRERLKAEGLDNLVELQLCQACGKMANHKSKDCPPIRKCTQCGLQSNQVGFPECISNKGNFVSHDMVEAVIKLSQEEE